MHHNVSLGGISGTVCQATSILVNELFIKQSTFFFFFFSTYRISSFQVSLYIHERLHSSRSLQGENGETSK